MKASLRKKLERVLYTGSLSHRYVLVAVIYYNASLGIVPELRKGQ